METNIKALYSYNALNKAVAVNVFANNVNRDKLGYALLALQIER